MSFALTAYSNQITMIDIWITRVCTLVSMIDGLDYYDFKARINTVILTNVKWLTSTIYTGSSVTVPPALALLLLLLLAKYKVNFEKKLSPLSIWDISFPYQKSSCDPKRSFLKIAHFIATRIRLKIKFPDFSRFIEKKKKSSHPCSHVRTKCKRAHISAQLHAISCVVRMHFD